MRTVRYKKEMFVPKPMSLSMERELDYIGPRTRATGVGRIGERAYIGAVVCDCPDGCGGRVNTDEAYGVTELRRGLRWYGVPCSNCDKSFTIESERSDDA